MLRNFYLSRWRKWSIQHIQRIYVKTVGAPHGRRTMGMILRIFNAKTNLTVNIYGKITVNFAKIRKIMLNSKKKRLLAPTVRFAVFRFFSKKRKILRKKR